MQKNLLKCKGTFVSYQDTNKGKIFFISGYALDNSEFGIDVLLLKVWGKDDIYGRVSGNHIHTFKQSTNRGW